MVMQEAGLRIEQRDRGVHIEGALDLEHFEEAKAALSDRISLTADLSGVTRLDTAGAMLLKKAKLEHVRPEHQAVFDMIAEARAENPVTAKRISGFARTMIRTGRAVYGTISNLRELTSFLGQATMRMMRAVFHPKDLRINSISHQIEAIAITAIPIIALIALVISIVLAYQGQVQLKPLGAQLYTVNLIAISVLREMGVLLTAIMVAGRSGSAFTAEIGSMKVREEIDALKAIGFNPFELLVLPRLIAMVISLPLLTLLANITGIFGGSLICLSILDMSVPEYMERARAALTWEDFFVGMVKAPVFALVIGLVGCMHGLKVSGSAESVGKETTASVVQSIFLVLVLDGLFSIYFEKIGL